MTQRKVIVRGATNQALDELDATDIPDLSATYEAAGATSAHTGDTSDAHDASAISFTPAGTIAATDVQAAIEEVASEASGAPTTADYLVGTANGGLSAEIVVGTTPGGELGGTWASPTVDATHSGSAHHTEDHDHDGSPTQKLLQANTHETPDTDTGTSSLHHTIGAGANQAAAGNHGHTGYAPDSVDYLVGTASGGLSGEIAVGTTPGGELGGTWASPTVDATHSGSAHHDAVTLAADADVLLGLSTQQLTLDSQNANLVFAGPASGSAADPTFRSLVSADVPQDHAGEYSGGGSTFAVDNTNKDILSVALTGLAAGDVLVGDAYVLYLNNSGATKTISTVCDLGGQSVTVSDGATIGASATNRSTIKVRFSVWIESTSSVHLFIEQLRGGPTAANTPATSAGLSSIRDSWNTSGSNLTGSQTLAVKIVSSAANATQTAWVLGWRVRRAT